MPVEKPKQFGPIFAQYDGSDVIQYAYKDPQNMNWQPTSGSPIDMLLASLGYCIILSMKWAADQRKISLNPFVIEIMGTKNLELPGKLEKIETTIIGDFLDDTSLNERVLKQAKAICTVSNSLNCDVAISTKK